MTAPAIVRFAPSPTGRLHIGNARTALYNVLIARQTHGQFILRLEDTDLKRGRPEGLEEIQDALRWLGLQWDQGPDIGGPHAPYNQTARKDIYHAHAQQLIASGHAYRCFCTPERLAEVREEQRKRKQPPRYDRACRAIPEAESSARAEAGESFVIRFKTPEQGTVTVHDLLRGDISVEYKEIDDYVLVRSNGLALYHLAAMVDDHLMGITHVFRGEEWLGSFPLHALIIRAFGWEEPIWCHLSIFLNPSGKGKMSKRNFKSESDIFILGLREQGYLPEAVNNWMALMGASFGTDEEVLTMDQLIERFSLERLNPAPARVNFEKLDHFNGVHIRNLSIAALAEKLLPFFEAAELSADIPTLQRIAPLIRDRIVTLREAVDMAGFFFRTTIAPEPNELVAKGLTPAQSLEALMQSSDVLAALPRFAHDVTEPAMRVLVERLGLKAGQVFTILRVAITGQTVSPPLFESMEFVGQAICLERIQHAIAQLRLIAAEQPAA